MYRSLFSILAVGAVVALAVSPALAGGGCNCGGGYAYSNGAYATSQPASTNVASEPNANRAYSYQPGTQTAAPVQVAAPPVRSTRGYRSYSYSPNSRSGYSFGVRSAASKANANYAPRFGSGVR